jgi:hypothetical protein
LNVQACGIPLVLWDCGYAEDRLKPFKSDSKESHWLTVESLRDLWRPLACQQYLVHTLFSSILSEWPTVVQADDDNSTTVPWNQMEGDWIKEVQEIERSKHRQLLQKRISGDDETVEQRLKKYQQRKEVKKRQWSAINQNSGDGGR